MTRSSVTSHAIGTYPTPKMVEDQVSFFPRGVVVEDLETGDVNDLVVVPVALADPSCGRISDVSPVGAALRNSKTGDVVVVQVPAGIVRYRVLSSIMKGGE
ncbi:MAG: GreA/GreB family elongation factor [Fibrella sp.]|nr:GreA/GreB family elongation factor [Armatimonadota bacterium]